MLDVAREKERRTGPPERSACGVAMLAEDIHTLECWQPVDVHGTGPRPKEEKRYKTQERATGYRLAPLKSLKRAGVGAVDGRVERRLGLVEIDG